MNGKDIRDLHMLCEGISNWARGKGKMGIDEIKVTIAQETFSCT